MPANITILGKIGKDAELRRSDKTGKEWLRFSIASHGTSGEKKTITWFEIVSFNTSLEPMIVKGATVSLTGEFELGETQQNEDGLFWTPLRVVADRIYVISDTSHKKAEPEIQEAAPEEKPAAKKLLPKKENKAK